MKGKMLQEFYEKDDKILQEKLPLPVSTYHTDVMSIVLWCWDDTDQQHDPAGCGAGVHNTTEVYTAVQHSDNTVLQPSPFLHCYRHQCTTTSSCTIIQQTFVNWTRNIDCCCHEMMNKEQ